MTQAICGALSIFNDLAPCELLKEHPERHTHRSWSTVFEQLLSLERVVTTLNAQAEDLVQQRNEGYRQRDDNFARAEAAEEREKTWQELAEAAYRHLWSVRAFVFQKGAIDVIDAISWRLEDLESKRAALARARTEEREACCEDVRAALTTGLLTPGNVEAAIRAIWARARASESALLADNQRQPEPCTCVCCVARAALSGAKPGGEG